MNKRLVMISGDLSIDQMDELKIILSRYYSKEFEKEFQKNNENEFLEKQVRTELGKYEIKLKGDQKVEMIIVKCY